MFLRLLVPFLLCFGIFLLIKFYWNTSHMTSSPLKKCSETSIFFGKNRQFGFSWTRSLFNVKAKLRDFRVLPPTWAVSHIDYGVLAKQCEVVLLRSGQDCILILKCHYVVTFFLGIRSIFNKFRCRTRLVVELPRRLLYLFFVEGHRVKAKKRRSFTIFLAKSAAFSIFCV